MTSSPDTAANRFAAYTLETFPAYRESLAAAARPCVQPAGVDALLAACRDFALGLDASLADAGENQGTVPTRTLLDALLTALARDGNLDDASSRRLDALQQRFEVRKRLYATYGRDLRQGAGETPQQPLRALLALCLLLRFAASGSCNDLNTALKLCDLLVADGLESEHEALPVALAAALLRERFHG